MKALSSKGPRRVWKVINRVQHPNLKHIRADPYRLRHFISAAEKTRGAALDETRDLLNLIDTLPEPSGHPLNLREVSGAEPLNEINQLGSGPGCTKVG